MKKLMFTCIAIVLLIVPVSVVMAEDSVQADLDALVRQWLAAIRAENVDGYAS